MTHLTSDEHSALIQIIDVLAERGSFKGTEFSTIGHFRARLVEAMQALAEEQVAQEKASEEASVAEGNTE